MRLKFKFELSTIVPIVWENNLWTGFIIARRCIKTSNKCLIYYTLELFHKNGNHPLDKTFITFSESDLLKATNSHEDNSHLDISILLGELKLIFQDECIDSKIVQLDYLEILPNINRLSTSLRYVVKIKNECYSIPDSLLLNHSIESLTYKEFQNRYLMDNGSEF
jgi:hypothetical protein